MLRFPPIARELRVIHETEDGEDKRVILYLGCSEKQPAAYRA